MHLRRYVPVVFLVGDLWSGRQTMGRILELSKACVHVNVGAIAKSRMNIDPSFKKAWGKVIENGILLPDNVVGALIRPYLVRACDTRIPLVFSDAPATSAQLGCLGAHLGKNSLRQAITLGLWADRKTCLARAMLRQESTDDYIDNRLNIHNYHQPEVVGTLREITADYSEFDARRTKTAVWQSICAALLC